MRVDFFGPDTEFFERGFFDPNSGDFNPDIIAANSSDIVLSNPATGWTVIITGFGFPADPENDPLSGTVQEISFMFGGTEFGPNQTMFTRPAFTGLVLVIVCLPLVFVFGGMFSLAVTR